MPKSSWLFIRDGESIWIERPYDFAIIIAGQGTARTHLEFPTEETLQAYQVATAERLSREGWFLWAFDRDRRQRDRRAAPRGTADRRQPLVEGRTQGDRQTQLS
jgi:hypothetical protein